jgi:hypothetical protein
VTRFVGLCVGAVALAAATGCGSSRTASPPRPGGTYPVVVAHPGVQTNGIALNPGLLRGGTAAAILTSPARIVFMTSGSTSCVWLPTRLTALGPSELRVDMRINGAASSCATGLALFPIAVKLGSGLVDVHQPLTIRLAYKANYGGRIGVQRRRKTLVAPAAAQS